MAAEKTSNTQGTKRTWTKPAINSNVPVNRTENGAQPISRQEDTFYQS